MTESINDLERDIAESRARLDLTIDRIQDRLSVSGIMDDLVGTVRTTEFGSVIDQALEVVRRNPVPVLLIAVGAGWLIHRMAQDRAVSGSRVPAPSRNAALAMAVEAESVPVLNTGQTRVYDPDAPTQHPMQDRAETRDLNARA